MSERLTELHNIQELLSALDQSHERPLLVFKHSLTCPISARAFTELESYLKHADSRVTYKLIIVQTARAVSNEVASRLRVAHQSPQAILICNGRDVWNASHSEITAEALDGAIRSADGTHTRQLDHRRLSR